VGIGVIMKKADILRLSILAGIAMGLMFAYDKKAAMWDVIAAGWIALLLHFVYRLGWHLVAEWYAGALNEWKRKLN